MDSFTLKKVEFHEVRRICSGFCRCSLGRRLALRMNPSRNPETVRHWLEQTTQMVAAVRDVGLPPTGGVADISGELERAVPGGGATAEDFSAIASTLRATGNVRDYLLSLGEGLDEVRSLAGEFHSFEDELAAIEKIISPEGEVYDEASEKLSALRGRMRSLEKDIHDAIYGFLRDKETARLLQDTTVTLHGDRYVLPVRAENRGRLKGVVHRASHSGATVFVEPETCVELNNNLTDLREDERREVTRLLNALAVKVSTRADDIRETLRACGRVDLLAAKAQYSYQFEMTRPQMHERGRVQLSGARHPLLVEQAHQQEKQGLPPEKRHPVVPIDVRLGQDFDLLVVTGSNTGGKTVTLKTVALLALMAQSGMHIPARRGAELPIFHDVFLDVGDEQSLQQSLSTFGAHIKRIRYILQHAKPNTLVLLDELGAGTDPDEGGAIGQAVLDELRRIGCPAMVTTHLSVLKAYAFSQDRVDNASVEFDTETLKPTYRLHIGTPGESHAITVAEHLGLPKRIISNARRQLSGQAEQFRRAIQATNLVRKSAEEARRTAREAQLAAEAEQQGYQSKLDDLHRLREQFRTWLARLSELKPGDRVHVPQLGKEATLIRMELHRQVALVSADGVHVEVPLTELMPDFGQAGVRQELDELRGQIMEQARQSEESRAEADRTRQEYHRSLQHQKARARQFDAWLGAIARLRVGQEVPIARKPGKGTVTKVDLPGLRATVRTGNGEMELPIQDLFPQTGPFARRQQQQSTAGGKRRRKRKGKEQGKSRSETEKRKDRPIRHRKPDSDAARKSREQVLSAQPGEQVFVVPFNKKATLVRLDADKDHAVVQSGVFEMEIPIADLEPVRS
ncbi:MAG: endonuclease MutS2 [Phycisphaerae bacterium]